MANLTGQDIEKLSKLLTSTLSFEDVETIVYSATGDQLYDVYVGRNMPLRTTLRDLLIALEKDGITLQFLSAVVERRPNRPDVRDAIVALAPEASSSRTDSIDLVVQNKGEVQPNEATKAFAPGLQRNIRSKNPHIDLHVWLQKLASIERQVCRIELSGNALGTGFLVGPAAVLTNWHVVRGAVAAQTLQQISCRFDYLRLEDGARQEGKIVSLHQDGCVDSSPYSAAELTAQPDTPLPDPDELDYALLRLEKPMGEDAINGSARGWMSLAGEHATLEKGAALLIVQHPDGSPMKLALDTDSVIGLNANGTRLRYTTNTSEGSSGSPCFSINWQLIALHHLGDPAWKEVPPTYNQGVPIGLIRDRIMRRGHGKLIGA